jgi:hypothetical protein
MLAALRDDVRPPGAADAALQPDSLATGDAETAAGDCGLGAGAGSAADSVAEGWPVSAAVDGVVAGSVVAGSVVAGSVVAGSVVAGSVVWGSVVSAGVAGSVEGFGGRVLGVNVGRETVGGDSVGRDTVGGEIVGAGALMLRLAAALDKALLMLPFPQPAARHPAARTASAMTSLAGIGFMAGPPLIAPNKVQNQAANLTHQRVRNCRALRQQDDHGRRSAASSQGEAT